tara:strand:+ start:1573 stop:2292 length:720 start_codon:yes stop_codon:yes gene_type:complete
MNNTIKKLIPKRIIVILGMHRSGTSFLTGSLQQAGVELGKYSEWNRHNKKGNRENTDIVELNDSVLAKNGGSWLYPPIYVDWDEESISEAKRILELYQSTDIFAFKDPRTIITLDGWLQLAPHSEFIGIFRTPSAVIASLVKRGEVSVEEGCAAWLAYNIKLLEYHKRWKFPLICFDWSEKKLDTKINDFCIINDLKPLNDSDRFFSSTLRSKPQKRRIKISLQMRYIYWRLRFRAVFC